LRCFVTVSVVFLFVFHLGAGICLWLDLFWTLSGPSSSQLRFTIDEQVMALAPCYIHFTFYIFGLTISATVFRLQSLVCLVFSSSPGCLVNPNAPPSFWFGYYFNTTNAFAGFNSLSFVLAGELWFGCQIRGAATRVVPTLLSGSDLIYSCSFVAVVYVVSLGFLYGNRIWSRSAVFWSSVVVAASTFSL